MGRLDRDSSPTSSASMPRPAIKPAINLIPVPELPMSKHRLSAPDRICFAAFLVETISPPSTPVFVERPKIADRCAIDLSSGTSYEP